MPHYQQVADVLRSDILTGKLAPGTKLPSERYLAGEFGVGVDVIRDALMTLRAENLLVQRQDQRVVVRGPIDRMFLTLQPGERVIARLPTQSEAARLDVEHFTPVLEVFQRDGGVELYSADRTGFREADTAGDWESL